MRPGAPVGEYGAEVLRGFDTSAGFLASGTQVDPDTVMEWPIQNRIALHSQGKIRFFEKPRTRGRKKEEDRKEEE